MTVDDKWLSEVSQRLGEIRSLSQSLREQAGDFPALECNCRRVLASLKMMEIDLGLVTVPLGEGPASQG